MAKIKTLYDVNKESFVPRTHVNAVTDDNGDSLASLLEAINETIDSTFEDASDTSEYDDVF